MWLRRPANLQTGSVNEKLTDTPTAELLKKAERNSFEKAIVQLSFPLSLMLIIISWFLIFRVIVSHIFPGILLSFLAAILIPLIIGSFSKFLSEWRGSEFIDELNRRHGRWNIPQYIRYYQEQLQPGEIRCILKTRILPHGSHFWACLSQHIDRSLKFRCSQTRGSSSTLLSPPWSEVIPHEKDLTPDQSGTLRQLIQESIQRGNQPIRIEQRIRDGCPAAMAIISGDGSEPVTIVYNLDLLDAPFSDDPRLELLKHLACLTDDSRFTRKFELDFDASSTDGP